MIKFKELKELNTDNILAIGREHDYELCVEEIDGYTVIQDEESLSELLADTGVVFISNDDEYYYYEINNVKFKVPYQMTEEDKEGISDAYLFFDIISEMSCTII